MSSNFVRNAFKQTFSCSIWNFLKVSGVTKIASRRTFCSKTHHIVQMRGLDTETRESDVIEYFKPLGVTPKAVYLKRDGSGRVSRVSEVEFATHAEAVVAMRKKNAFMGNRFIRLELRSTDDGSDQQKKSVMTENQTPQHSAKCDLNIAAGINASHNTTGFVIKMKNAPPRITDQDIYQFFRPVGVTAVSMKPFYNESGSRTGEFDVYFLSKDEASKAMSKNNTYLRGRFIELTL